MLSSGNLPGAEYLPRYTTVTFGALIEGSGLTSVNSTTLRSQAVTYCRADINVLRYSKEKEATPEKWLLLIKAQTEKNKAVNIKTAWKEHLGWWRDFWDRSRLVITGGADAWRVTSFYLHQRFIYACQTGDLKENWRIPFNGGIFNVDFQDVELPGGLPSGWCWSISQRSFPEDDRGFPLLGGVGSVAEYPSYLLAYAVDRRLRSGAGLVPVASCRRSKLEADREGIHRS